MNDEAGHDAAAIELVIEGRPRPVGTMTVARLLPAPKRRMIGPFIFIDHMGPVELAPGVGFDIPPHPHIGLSTVTYFLAGENVHRDSLGNVQTNAPGDVNLMTAGRGVVHSERADPAWRARGGVMHGLQIWLALPEANEDDDASFAHHPAATLPAIASAGVRGRVLIGSAFGATSPIEHPSQPLLVELELEAGAGVAIPDAAERGVFVIEGEVEIAGHVLVTDRLAVIAPTESSRDVLRLDATSSGVGRGARVDDQARRRAGGPPRDRGQTLCATTAARVMIVGGPPLGARFIDWNFVASSKERIDRARDAWKAQAFPLIPTDRDEFVPYPDLNLGS